jgi:hypothetical protein
MEASGQVYVLAGFTRGKGPRYTAGLHAAPTENRTPIPWSLHWLGKTKKSLCLDNRSQNRYSNPGPAEYPRDDKFRWNETMVA